MSPRSKLSYGLRGIRMFKKQYLPAYYYFCLAQRKTLFRKNCLYNKQKAFISGDNVFHVGLKLTTLIGELGRDRN